MQWFAGKSGKLCRLDTEDRDKAVITITALLAGREHCIRSKKKADVKRCESPWLVVRLRTAVKKGIRLRGTGQRR